jgi:hypothetical protein
MSLHAYILNVLLALHLSTNEYRINRDKTSELNIWIGDAHNLPDGIKLLVTLARSIDPNHIGTLVILLSNILAMRKRNFWLIASH